MRCFQHPDRPCARSWYGIAPRTLNEAFPGDQSPLLGACDTQRDPWLRWVVAVCVMVVLGLMLGLRG